MSNKVALVTGSNKGIGREIARGLGRLGMVVYASARDEERGRHTAEELRNEGIDVRFLQLDVTDEESIRRAADEIDRSFGRLDVLVNNAGITVDDERPTRTRPSNTIEATSATADHLRQVFEVNTFGTVAVTRAMLPLLRRSDGARVVNMSSPLGSLTLHSDLSHPVSQVGLLAYSSSKAALNMITIMYANALRDTGIKVNAANPGRVATALNDFSGERTPEQGAAIAIRLATLGDDGPTGGFFGDDGPVPW
jgi:NAD(P)-dependent dehydrogenase (short-subunit alcohol dehydrogenase family)